MKARLPREFAPKGVRSNPVYVSEGYGCASQGVPELGGGGACKGYHRHFYCTVVLALAHLSTRSKLTWLVLGGDPVARSHRVEQFTAL